MPLDTIYLTRHGHRLSWTIDYKTGIYHSNFPTPTGNPADPPLTAHGVRQSHELAAYFVSDNFAGPRPWRIYSSPFYRCLQTIQPTIEALDRDDTRLTLNPDRKEKGVRIENGLGEWFGASTYFDHPSPSSVADLHTHFPSIVPDPKTTTTTKTVNSTHVIPSTRGETIPQLHNRVATTLAAIIADADADIRAEEERDGNKTHTSKAILICSHAATLIAMGRCLTGNMPEDYNVDDFHVYTAGLSTFKRRRREAANQFHTRETGRALIAEGTKLSPKSEIRVPIWEGGKGVGGGWDCVRNCDCNFLSGGEERGWHFNGEESFDTGPMTGNEPAKL